jgi:hypothetical protein
MNLEVRSGDIQFFRLWTVGWELVLKNSLWSADPTAWSGPGV